MYYICDICTTYVAYVFEISATTPTLHTVSHIMINICFFVVNSIIKLMKLAIGSQGVKCEIYMLP